MIENDHTTVIRHDQHLTVENDQFTQIKHNQHLTVEGRVVRSSNSTAAAKSAVHCSKKSAAKRFTMQAQRFTLKRVTNWSWKQATSLPSKSSGSFVKVDAGGVHVVGSAINLNSGGSAGSGSGYGGKMAELPQGVDKAKTPQEIELAAVTPTQQSMSPLLKARQIEALKGPAPVCEVCEEAKGN
ncbi:type VI secretion protein VgrG [Vibrio cholerae]